MSAVAADLEAGLAAHRGAVEEFASRAARVGPDAWARPPAPEKWSPAELTEHLRLALAAVAQELAGGAGMRPVLPGWTRLLLRWSVLPRILGGGWFPKGARAPRETRPTAPDGDPTQALRRLAAELERYESICRACPPRARLTHPYFGRLPLARANRLLAAHARHHAGQLPPSTEET